MGHSIKSILMAASILLAPSASAGDGDKLRAELDGDTPLVEDLKYLTDTIGGRAMGSKANDRAVDWIAARLREAGLDVSTPSFDLPRHWVAGQARATISSNSFSFEPTFVPRVYSASTNGDVTASIVDIGLGTEEDFARAGNTVRDAFALVHTPVLTDEAGLAGLFSEYIQSYHAKARAAAAGARGVIYVSSRPKGLMMRHVSVKAFENTLITATIDRENGLRIQRAIKAGEAVSLTANITADDTQGGTARNVIAEIRGSERPDEIVIIGAHMDSHDLGTGALDNGTNTSIVMDIARQIKTSGIAPKRTIRFALWNGEEYGMLGSGAYVASHMDEMDNHIVSITHDIGGGRITGYFVNGGAGLLEETNTAMDVINDRGPFANVVAPLVGTDNYDFMMYGVPNLIANQEDATYASNYHAQSDTFDKVDTVQLKKNAAIAGHTVLHFANSDWRGTRATAEEIARMVETNQLHPSMDSFGLLDAWLRGERGMNPKPIR